MQTAGICVYVEVKHDRANDGDMHPSHHSVEPVCGSRLHSFSLLADVWAGLNRIVCSVVVCAFSCDPGLRQLGGFFRFDYLICFIILRFN